MHRTNSLTLDTLIYATDCLERGQWAVLRDLNFGTQEIEALQSLHFCEFISVADRLDGHFLNIELDRERFWLVLQQMRQEREIINLKGELICRDAPVDMMTRLFGITEREYTDLRRRYRADRSAGRPPEPDIETADRIWQAWQQQLNGAAPENAQQWLALSKASGANCRTLWRFIRDTLSMAAS